MELIVLTDGIFHLVEVTKEMTQEIELFAKVDCFDGARSQIPERKGS